MNSPLPLAIDLDGTLIRTDVLYESAAVLLRRQPWLAFALPVWLAQGRARMKREIARRVTIDAALLPYNEDFTAWASAEFHRGRTVILATASDLLLARKIAAHLPIFHEVIGSEGGVNQKGLGKLATLESRFGRAFAYAGNSRADLPIWQGCQEAILVNASPATAAAARKLGNVVREFPPQRLTYTLVRQVLRGRLCQLILLCALPLILLTGNPLWAIAGLAICCLVSGLLLTRDLLTLDASRRLPAPGPLATGVFPIASAFFLAPSLLVAGAVLFLYIALNSALRF